MNKSEAIEKIALSLEASNILKKVLYMRVEEKMIADVELPAMVISSLDTSFIQHSRSNLYKKEVEINAVVSIKDTINPLEELENKEIEIIKHLLGTPDLNELGIEILSTTVSNSVRQFQEFGFASFMLKFKITLAQGVFL